MTTRIILAYLGGFALFLFSALLLAGSVSVWEIAR